MDNKNMQWNIIIAFFAFIGTAVGAYVSSHMQHERWLETTHYEQKKTILQERIRLIERTSNSISSRSRAKTLDNILNIESTKVSALYDICIKEIEDNGNADLCKHVKSDINSNEYNAELNKLNTEFNTVVLMNAIYFCNKTKKELDSLSTYKKWWLIPHEKYIKVIEAMVSELYCNIP